MNAIFGGIINHTVQSFSVIFIMAMVTIMIGGGLFPESIFEHTEIVQNFEVPLVFMERTSSNRVYMKTTYNKANVNTGKGALEVDYTTSKQDYVGIKTTAFSLDRMINISFALKADRATQLALRLKNKQTATDAIKLLDVTTEWQTFTFNAKELLPKDYTNKSITHNFSPYFEISAPPSEEQQIIGKFWIDSLEIQLY